MIIKRSHPKLKLLVPVLSIILLVVVFFVLPKRTDNQLFDDPNFGLVFSYSTDLEQTKLTEQDHKGSIFLRLQPNSSLAANLLVTARAESGLAKVSAVTKQTPLEIIASNIERTYPSRFSGWQLQTERTFDISGRPAKEIIFSYNGPAEPITQRFLVIIKNDDSAIFLSAQAPTAQYGAVNQAYFESIFDSVSIE
ncbi:MAG TPA: hypothetical protein VGA08_01610 [Candidatus Saccharimonadales bacterium]